MFSTRYVSLLPIFLNEFSFFNFRADSSTSNPRPSRAMNASKVVSMKNLLCVVLGLIASLVCDARGSDVSCAQESDVIGFCACVCSPMDKFIYDVNRCVGECVQLLISDEEDDVMGNEFLENDISPGEKRKSSFVRIGRSADPALMRRTSSFVRIGKSLQQQQQEDSPFSFDDDVSKRASSFVRIGKSTNYPRFLFKRPSSFVRIGQKSVSAPASRRASSFVRIGKSVGQSLDDVSDKRASSFVRIGKSLAEEEAAKRASSFVRIGKSSEAQHLREQLMRVEGLAADDKRASSFVRIGKSLRDGEEPDQVIDNIGLYPASGEAGDSEKRGTSSFVRIGRNSAGGKRVSSFVRIGKRSAQPAADSDAAALDDAAHNGDVSMR